MTLRPHHPKLQIIRETALAAVPATTAVWWAIAASTLVAEPMVHALSSSALASLRLPATAAVAGSLSRATGAALG